MVRVDVIAYTPTDVVEEPRDEEGEIAREIGDGVRGERSGPRDEPDERGLLPSLVVEHADPPRKD